MGQYIVQNVEHRKSGAQNRGQEVESMKYGELAELIKNAEENAEDVVVHHVHHVMGFVNSMTASKKKKVTLTLSFDDDVLVEPGNVSKWRGQLLLVWITYKDKKEFLY